ncbi:MAG: hypothetical protein Q8835_02485 [Sweet potato little leaf phytoplasma]|nr:hypothetical protein [Sweet potato little leaf phytoplasma]
MVSGPQHLMTSAAEKKEPSIQENQTSPPTAPMQHYGKISDDLNHPPNHGVLSVSKLGNEATQVGLFQSAHTFQNSKSEVANPNVPSPPQQASSFAELVPQMPQIVVGLPNSKSWKRLARNLSLDDGNSSISASFKKRMGDGILNGNKKRARTGDDEVPEQDEPTVEAVEQPRREP